MAAITRRTALIGIPAICTAAVAPVPAESNTEDLASLIRLINAHRDAMLECSLCSDDDWHTAYGAQVGSRLSAARAALAAHRPRSLEEVRIKASFMADEMLADFEGEPDIEDLFRSLIPSGGPAAGETSDPDETAISDQATIRAVFEYRRAHLAMSMVHQVMVTTPGIRPAMVIGSSPEQDDYWEANRACGLAHEKLVATFHTRTSQARAT